MLRGGSRKTGQERVLRMRHPELKRQKRQAMGRKKKIVDLDRDNGIAPGLEVKTKKRLVVAGGRSHPALNAAVAEALGMELAPTEHRTFASGEIYARFEVSIRGCDLFLIQTFGQP